MTMMIVIISTLDRLHTSTSKLLDVNYSPFVFQFFRIDVSVLIMHGGLVFPFTIVYSKNYGFGGRFWIFHDLLEILLYVYETLDFNRD